MPSSNYTLLIDWPNDTLFTSAGVNVTTRTLHVEFNRGRDVNSQLVGKSVAGSLQAVLNNQSGDYNSYNSTGPLSGSLLPGRMVRFQQDGTTIWQGYVERILPAPSVKALDRVVIEAIGPLGYINRKKISVRQLTNVDVGTIVNAILDETGLPSASRDIDTGKTTVVRYWADRLEPLDALRKVEDSESGFIREDKSGKIVFENRHRRLSSPYYTSTATFTDDPTGTIVYMDPLVQEDPLPFIFNEMVATVTPYTTGAATTLWKMGQTGTTAPVINPSSTIILWAKYPNPTATNNAVGADSWTTPTATTDYNVFNDSAGTGSNLNGSTTLTVTSFGNEFKMVFRNAGTAVGYITLLQVRGVPLLSSDPLVISVEDSTSQTRFGTRTRPSPAPFIPNPQEAKDWGDWNVAIYKDPIVRLQMTYIANRSSAMLTQAASRDISDRITVVGTGTRSNMGLNRAFYIEALKHVVEADRTHTVTYMLSEAVQASDGWVLDVSELGTRTRLGY